MDALLLDDSVDAYLIECLFDGPTDCDPPAVGAPTNFSLRVKRSVPHYALQKQRKVALQQEIVVLTARLKQAKKEKTKSTDATSSQALLWSNLAKRRLESRLAAEAQRKWLIAAIKGKTLLIEDMKQVVRQHLKIASLIAAGSSGCDNELFIQLTDDLLYAMDFQDINALYAQTDFVFSGSGLSPMAEVNEIQRSVTADVKGVSVQFARRQHFMYSFQQTWKAMWMLSSHIHRQFERVEFDGLDDPETTHAVKFGILCPLSAGRRTLLTQRIATRCFTEEARAVFVWKSFVAGEGALSGIQTDESGWAVIRPAKFGSGTIMEVCVKQVPLHLNECGSVSESVVTQFNSVLENVVQENYRDITTGAEALLEEDALSSISQLHRGIARRRR